MKKIIVAYCLAAMFLAGKAVAADNILKMSTTTSTQSSGLLDILLPEFEKDEGIKVKVIAKGTGAAIRDGMDGNVDIIFVHARAREDKFVSEGYGTKRYGVMHNDFVILGPLADPAKIKGSKNAVEALEKIATSTAAFISRGDDSGTHTKEQNLWKSTSLKLTKKSQTIIKKGKKKEVTFNLPENSKAWYISIGQGMGKTVTYADESQSYTLSDRGTFIKYKYGKNPSIDLEVLCEGDRMLANPYGIIPVNPQKHAHVKIEPAEKFAKWITSPRGQKLINDYRLVGRQLFYPDAVEVSLLK